MAINLSALKRIWLVAAALVIAGFAGWTLRGAPPLPQGAKADLVVVHKAARRLELYQQGALLKSYAVSLGRHPYGNKQQQGDGRTPEGEYRLDYRKPDSAFHQMEQRSFLSHRDTQPPDHALTASRSTSNDCANPSERIHRGY
jgi:hypothetical protein